MSSKVAQVFIRIIPVFNAAALQFRWMTLSAQVHLDYWDELHRLDTAITRAEHYWMDASSV